MRSLNLLVGKYSSDFMIILALMPFRYVLEIEFLNDFSSDCYDISIFQLNLYI